MDILSPDTLALLLDENLRKAVDELLGTKDGDQKTVTVTRKTDDSAGGTKKPTEVTVRRVA